MDGEKKEGKEYFQINLDTVRIFWISFIFSLILIGVFFLGFYSGGGKLKRFLGEIKREQVKTEQKPVLQEKTTEAPQQETSLEIKKPDTDVELINLINKEFEAKTQLIDVEGVAEPADAHKTTRVAEPETYGSYASRSSQKVSTSRTIPSKTKTGKKTSTSLSRYIYRPVGDYYIQVASFMEKENAEKFAKKLRKDRYRVQILETDINDKKFYRVRVGPFEKKSIARNTMIAMRRLYNLNDAYVVKQR